MFRAAHRLTLAALVMLASTITAQAQTAPEVVDLKAADGVTLKATYYSAGKPGPAILLLHACNRDRSSWKSLATQAAASGFHVLALDFRGFGESEGTRYEDYRDRGPEIAEKWPGDVDAAFNWLVSRPGVDRSRVGAAGASCGVNQSTLLARRHPEVKTLVMLSGGLNAEAREYVNQSSWLPVFAAASLDDGNAVEQMRWVTGWSKHPASKFVEYKAAGHGTDMFAVEKGLEPMVVAWFDKHLRNAPTTPPAQAAYAKTSPAEAFWSALAKGDITGARQIYKAAKKDDPKAVLFPENELNLHGYALLQEGKAKDAVDVFRLNVEEYPASANTYDSLADGYLAAENTAEALRYAEKALAMLAADTRMNDELREAIRESAEKKVRDLKK